MRSVLRTGWGAVLVLTIMITGSLGLWVGMPLLWLWIASQIQGATQSLGSALGAAFAGVLITVLVVGTVLSRLSEIYRANCLARGLDDPGHNVLEGVLVVSAGISTAVFAVWFLFFAGAAPAPLGLQI
jgi:predicted DNA repair protein MutK